jgi:pimeloyl-ACP methyl ester carboxylesterase
MALPVTRYAKSGDVHIAYQVFGSGPIDLVVIPGFVSHIEAFWDHPDLARWLLRLPSFARVATFDKRGTGLSDRVAELPSFDLRMDDARAVMDAAGMERAALLGISEGGPMATLFAAPIPSDAEGWHSTAALPEPPPGLRPPDWSVSSDISINPGAVATICRCSRRRVGTNPRWRNGGADTSDLARARRRLSQSSGCSAKLTSAIFCPRSTCQP